MLKRIFLVLTVVLIAVAAWIWFGISRVIQSEQEVVQRFRETVQYYVSMDQEYVLPLLSASGGVVGQDLERLNEISSALRNLGILVSTDDQYSALLSAQKSIISFVGGTGYPEQFVQNTRYQEWSKNSTNFGEASVRIKAYNEALSVYNTRIASAAGKLAGLWKRWRHHQFLGIDGSLTDHIQVSF